MTYYGEQFLYLSNAFGNASEVFNGARTARRLIESEDCGSGTFTDVLDNAGCDALLMRPCTMADDGTVDGWTIGQLSPETAPWYDGTDASVEGYGFYIEEWTGLDDAHHARSVTGIGANRGGARFGPSTANHRVMMLNVLLLGSSQRGLDHLFRWLSLTLLRSCGGCEGQDLWVREFCPTNPVVDPTEGLARIRKVGLLEGLKWEAAISDRAGCSVRRASFTLGAEDPCKYREPTTVLAATAASFTPLGDGTTTVTTDGQWAQAGFAAGVQGDLSDIGATGVLAPRVTINAGLPSRVGSGRSFLPDLRIAGYANPAGGAVKPGTAFKVGELILTGRGTSGLEIVVDMAEREVRYRETTGPWGQWYDGSRLIGRHIDSSVRRWWSLAKCDIGAVVVEPVYRSGYNATEAANSPVGSAWTVAIQSVERYGCP